MLWDLLSVRKIKQIFPCKKKKRKEKENETSADKDLTLCKMLPDM